MRQGLGPENEVYYGTAKHDAMLERECPYSDDGALKLSSLRYLVTNVSAGDSMSLERVWNRVMTVNPNDPMLIGVICVIF